MYCFDTPMWHTHYICIVVRKYEKKRDRPVDPKRPGRFASFLAITVQNMGPGVFKYISLLL